MDWGRSPREDCSVCEGSGWIAIIQSNGQKWRALMEGEDSVPNIDIAFDHLAHAYAINGQPAISVTQLLQAEGFSWCPFWTEEGRKRGTAVHQIALLLGGTPWEGRTPTEIVENSRWDAAGGTPALVPYGMALARWYLEGGFRPELTEQPVASLRHMIAGTLDQYGKMPDGRRTLVDFKSGQPQEAAHVQVALYEMCLEETLGLKTDDRMVIWLKPDGNYKVVAPKLEPSVYMHAGLSAVNCYKWRERFKKL